MSETTTPGLASVPVEVQTTSPKGANLKGTIPMSADDTEGLLAKMQAFVDEREGPMANIAKGLTLGMATARGPSAYAAVQREQNLQDKQMMEYQQTMAAYKSAGEQAKQDAADYASKMGGTGGTSGAPGTYGGVPLDDFIKAQLNGKPAHDRPILQEWLKTKSTESTKADYNPTSLVRNDALITDPQTGKSELRSVNAFEYRQLRAAGLIKDPTEFYNLRPSTDNKTPAPAANSKTLVPIDGSKVPVAAADANAPLSVRNNNPGNMRDTKTGDFRTFPTAEEGDKALQQDLALKISGQSPAVKERFGPQVGNFISPAMLAEVWSPTTAKGNSPESTVNYAKHIAAKLGIEPTAQIPNTPEAIAAAKVAIAEFERGAPSRAPAEVAVPKPAAVPTPAPAAAAAAAAVPTPAPAAAAVPTSAPAAAAVPAAKPMTAPTSVATAPAAAVLASTTPKTGMPNIAEMQAERKVKEEEANAAARKRGESGEADRVEFERDIKPTTIADEKATNQRIQKLVSENPGITGVLAGPGYAKAVAGQLERGIGNVSINDLSTAILQTLPNTTNLTMAERNELGTYLARMELKAAKLIKGQGQITEGEREILQRASSSLKDPAEAIYKKAKMLERIADLNAELGKIYGNGSKYPNFRDFAFSDDPRVLDIHARYTKDLENILNEKVDFRKNAPGAPAPAAPKEGDTGKSKTGRDTIFKNGQWVYK